MDRPFTGNSVADGKGSNWPPTNSKPDKNWQDPRFKWMREWVKKQKSKSK